MWYILEGKTLVHCCDTLKAAKWFGEADRIIAKDTIGEHKVSTVFLCIDHSHEDHDQPLLFETGVFNGKGEMIDCDRYSTWEEAESGHKELMQKYS